MLSEYDVNPPHFPMVAVRFTTDPITPQTAFVGELAGGRWDYTVVDLGEMQERPVPYCRVWRVLVLPPFGRVYYAPGEQLIQEVGPSSDLKYATYEQMTAGMPADRRPGFEVWEAEWVMHLDRITLALLRGDEPRVARMRAAWMGS